MITNLHDNPSPYQSYQDVVKEHETNTDLSQTQEQKVDPYVDKIRWSQLNEQTKSEGMHPRDLARLHFDIDIQSNFEENAKTVKFLMNCKLAASEKEFYDGVKVIINTCTNPLICSIAKLIFRFKLPLEPLPKKTGYGNHCLCLALDTPDHAQGKRLGGFYAKIVKQGLAHLIHSTRKEEFLEFAKKTCKDPEAAFKYCMRFRYYGHEEFQYCETMKKIAHIENQIHQYATVHQQLVEESSNININPSKYERIISQLKGLQSATENLLNEHRLQSWFLNLHSQFAHKNWATLKTIYVPGDFSFIDNTISCEREILTITYKLFNHYNAWSAFDWLNKKESEFESILKTQQPDLWIFPTDRLDTISNAPELKEYSDERIAYAIGVMERIHKLGWNQVCWEFKEKQTEGMRGALEKFKQIHFTSRP